MYAAILCANPQGLQVIFERVITWTRTLNGPLTKVCLLIKVIVCMYCTNCCLLLCFYHDYLTTLKVATTLGAMATKILVLAT